MCVSFPFPPKRSTLHFNDKIPKLGFRDEEGALGRALSECFFWIGLKRWLLLQQYVEGKWWNAWWNAETWHWGSFVALTTQVEPYIPIDPASLLGFHYQLYSQIWPILAREDAQDVKELAMFKRKVTKLFYRKVFMTCVIIMIHLGSILPFPCLNSIRPQGMMVRMKMMSSPRVFWLEIRQSWRVRPKFIGKRYSLFHT